MPRSDYAMKLTERMARNELLAQTHGQQQILDFSMIYLHRHGWDTEQIMAYWNGVHALIDEYHDAFRFGMEQDVAQERMDWELQDAMGEHFTDSFAARYGLVVTAGYDKMPREKKEKLVRKKGRKR